MSKSLFPCVLPNARSVWALMATAVSSVATMAGVVVNENAAWPTDPRFTAIPFTVGVIDNERDVRFNRNLGQTFQLANPQKLDKIFVGYEEGLPGKEITIRLFTVANVNAGTLIEPGAAAFTGTTYFSIVYTTTDAINQFDGGNNPLGVMEFDLTDADEVTLPATTGAEGYCFQIVRTGAGATADVAEERAFKWHWNDGENVYAGGRGFAVNGGTIDGADDFVLAIEGPDEAKPTIADVRGNEAGDRLTVVFSEGVDAVTAGAVGNYTVPGLTLSAPEILTPTTVRFTTTAQTAGAAYTLTVINVKDDSANANTIEANSTYPFKALQAGPGFLTAEFFKNMDPRAGSVIDLLVWQPFIDNKPDEVRNLPTLSTPGNYGEDYGVRVTGVLVPKETASYIFAADSDDGSAFYINLTGASIPDANSEAPWVEDVAGGGATASAPVTLTVGQRYGVLFLLKEGGGNDYGRVMWYKETDPVPTTFVPISGEFFESALDGTGATLSITTQPTAPGPVMEGTSAQFSVEVASSLLPDGVGYQWFKNGVAIPNAIGATYTLLPVPGTDDGAKFKVQVRVPGTRIDSDEVTLSVIQDNTAPTVVSARPGTDRTTVNVVFSERIDATSAGVLENYGITPALGISEARVINSTNVQLVTAEQTIGTEYTLTINGVADFAGNAIAANTQIKFIAVGPLLQGDNGFVIWEAENYDRYIGTDWSFNPIDGQPSGTGSMENPNGTGAGEFTDHLEYDILFTKSGRHLIWVRAGADNRNGADPGTADSVWLHVYPVGTQPTRPVGAIDRTASNDAALTGFSGGSPITGFVWARNAGSGISPIDFDIPTPGIYTIGIGTREDGAFVDKFVITQNPAYTPTLLGPPLTPRQGEAAPTPSAVTITQNPTNRTVFQNLAATFTVAASSADPLIAYQWQRRTNDGSFVDIPGGTAPTLTINPATSEWSGAVVRARVSVTGYSTNSAEATLTIIVDNAGPTVQAVRGRSDKIALTVVYSEAVDPIQAVDLANYSAGALTLFDATLVTDRAVRFTTSDQTQGTEYTLTINGVRDLAQNPIAGNTQAKFFGVGPLQQRDDGYVVWEAEDYDRKLGTWNENSASFVPSGGLSMRVISGGEFTDHLEFDINFTHTGTHTIYYRARADDGNSDSMWLHVYPQGASAARPPNRAGGNQASLSGFNVGAASDFVWRSDAQEGSDPMTFDIPEPGVYTIGIGRRENGSYLDKLLIRANTTFVPTGYGPAETPRQGEPTLPADLTITRHPSSLTLLENRAGKITIGFTTSDGFVTLQWQQKIGGVFEDIAGATGTNLVIDPALSSMNGNVYRAKITVTGRTEFSNEATLTVNEDAAAPVAETAGAFINGSVVGVRFNEPLKPDALGTFSVSDTSGPANVVGATLYLERYVRITLERPIAGPGFTLTASGAQDIEGNVSPTILLAGTLSDLTGVDVGTDGDPVEFGDTFTWGPGYYVAGGGSDIFGNADHGYFVYKQVTGAFDMRARVDDLIGGDEWGKAILMARESLAAGSRNAGVLITKTGPFVAPTTGGMDVYNFQWRDATDGASASTATALRISPTVFPSWLRLVRETATTSKLDAYMSYDGQAWIPVDTHTIPTPTLPETLYLGMAMTAHDNAVGFPRAEAAFESFSIAPLGGGDPNLRISQGAGGITLQWDSGTLVSSATVDGTYAPVNGASSPHTAPTSESARFYQVRTP